MMCSRFPGQCSRLPQPQEAIVSSWYPDQEYGAQTVSAAPDAGQLGQHRGWRSELYAVTKPYVREIIARLAVPEPTVDAFSLARSRRFCRFWGPDSDIVQDAFAVHWHYRAHELIWMNPPYSRLAQVVWKIKQDHCHCVIVVPKWDQEDWYQDLLKILVRCVIYPAGTSLFELCGEHVHVPPTRWAVVAAFVCGRPAQCFHWGPSPGMSSRSQLRRKRRQKLQECRAKTSPMCTFDPGRHEIF